MVSLACAIIHRSHAVSDKHSACCHRSWWGIKNLGSGDSSVVRAPDLWLKGMGLNPCRSSGIIFFSRVNFLCWLLFWYPPPPPPPPLPQSHVKDPGHSAKSAGGRLQLNTHTPYVCGFAWNDMEHGCMVCTEHAEMAAVSCCTSHASAVSTPLWWIFKNVL